MEVYMSGDKKYSDEYPLMIALWVRYEGKKSNRDIAKYFKVSASTISEWRKEYSVFDKAVTDPNGAVSQQMINKLFALMESDSEVTINNAINSLVRLGFGSSKGLDNQIKEEVERQLDKSDNFSDEVKALKIYKSWKGGDLENGEAEAKLLFAGLPVPQAITNELDAEKEERATSTIERMASLRDKGAISQADFNDWIKNRIS
jgi:transposase-like protein